MAVPPTARFWALMGQVMRYAVDIADDYPLTIDDYNFGSITPEIFLSDLYVPWDRGNYENRLAHHLRTAKSLVVVAGGRGAGKTSSLLWASRQLVRTSDRIRVLNFNMRRLYDRLSLQRPSLHTPYAELQSHLELEVRRLLFPDLEDARDLIAWLLAGPPDPEDPFDDLLISDLHNQSVRTRTRAKVATSSVRSQRVAALRDWFILHEQEFAALHHELEPIFRLRHSILARAKLDQLDKIVLIYDNVDKIPGEFQTTFIEVANDSQLAMGPIATTCVAIRTEHLRGPWEGQERGGTLVHLILPDERQYNGVLLPILEQAQVSQIITRRHSFASRRYEAHFPTEPSAVFLPIIHRAILDQFRESDVHRLTNENLRAVAALYVGFMQYLYSLSETRGQEFPTLFSGEGRERHAHTLFFLWLRSHGPLANVHLYDVLRPVTTQGRGATFREVASIHHFLLTTVANLTDDLQASAGPHEYPEFRMVVARLAELGFDLDEVRRAIKVMLPEEEGEGTLEFTSSEPLVDQLTAGSKDRLRLTKLGRILVTEVFSKVGYVWSLAHARAVTGGTQDPDLAYLEMPAWSRINIIFDYVCTLAGSHLHVLSRLSEEWSARYGPEWLERYRRHFGIDGKVQVERILQETVAFYGREFRMRKQPNVFEALQALYAIGIDRVLGRNLDSEPFEEAAERLKRRVGIGGSGT